MAYLLDTNAWIVYLKSPFSKVGARLQALLPIDIVTCSIVKAELYHGSYKYANADARRLRLDKLFAPCASYSFGEREALIYADIRNALERKGKVIGPNDLLIAATALANGLVLVTHNTAEFSEVPNLPTEDWEL
jgi:tRNA(fMet)-specific endonuclease VapC